MSASLISRTELHSGFYYDNGNLIFYGDSDASLIAVPAGEYARVALTRDASGMLRGYVNGALAFTADDSTSAYGVIDSNNTLRFFQDNTSDGTTGEASSGTVSRIRIWDGVLSGDQISAQGGLTILKLIR